MLTDVKNSFSMIPDVRSFFHDKYRMLLVLSPVNVVRWKEGKENRPQILFCQIFSCYFHVQFRKNLNLASRCDIVVLLTF